MAGTAAVTIDGLLRGKPVSVSLEQVSTNHRSGLSYSFRYFQDYDEPVQLPPGLEPTRIGIEIRTGNKDFKVQARKGYYSIPQDN